MAHRRPHIIRGNKGNSVPSHVMVLSTEVRSEQVDRYTKEDVFVSCWVSHSRRYQTRKWSTPTWTRFEDTDAIWALVVSRSAPKRRLYIFGYDVGGILTVGKAFAYFSANGWQNTYRILGKTAFAITWVKDGRTLVFVDTVNLFRATPDEMAESFGLPAPERATGYLSESAVESYALPVGRVLITALIAWFDLIQSQNLGNFALTLAGQAMAAYRHRFMPTAIFVPVSDDSLALSREAYYGGRAEAYQLGAIPEKVYGLDVNSMFAYQMSRHPVPIKLLSTYRTPRMLDLERLAGKYALVATVDIDTPEPVYPVRHLGKTMFPVGPFRTTLTTPEILYAQEHGHLRAVHELYVYDQAVIFAEYVEHFWSLRAAAIARGDELTVQLGKSLLNSLYGKWGQKGQIWREVYRTEDMAVRHWSEWYAEEEKYYHYRQFLGMAEEYQDESESRESFPAISAHITAQARMHLWDLMLTAGRENVYYCDTDSLFVNATGRERLQSFINPLELGGLRQEWETDELVINGIKDYSIGKLRRIKGITHKAQEVSPGVYRQDEVRGFAGMIRAGDIGRRLITDVEKILQRDYAKGEVDQAGRVHPLRIPQ